MSVDVDMFRKHEVHLPVTHFKLGDPLFSFQRAGRNTIFAWLASAPNLIAVHRRSHDFAAFIQLKDLVRFRINKAHHFKHTAQVIQEMRYVVFRALFERIFSAPYHFILNIFKASEHAGIIFELRRPKRYYRKALPAIFPVNGDLHNHFHFRSFRRCCFQLFTQSDPILFGKQRNVVPFRQIHGFFSLIDRRIPIFEMYGICPVVKFKLDAAALLCEEFRLFLLEDEQAVRTVIGHKLFLLEHFVGKTLCFLTVIEPAGVCVHVLEKLILHVQKALYQKRIEGAAFAVCNHFNSGRVVERLFVAAFACKRVVHVCHGDDLRGNRNFIALEAVRVAAAVPTLVMPAADLMRQIHQRFGLLRTEVAQHRVTDGGVILHDFPLFGVELAWLI